MPVKNSKNMSVVTWSVRVLTVSKSGLKCFAENAVGSLVLLLLGEESMDK